MQCYEEQVRVLCQQLRDSCGSVLKPQAFAPHAYPTRSGSSVCQLATATTANSYNPTTHDSSTNNSNTSVSGLAASYSNAIQQQRGPQHAALPELQQLLSTNQELLVTFLVDTWQNQQQQEAVHQRNIVPGPSADISVRGQQSSSTDPTSTAAALTPNSSKVCSKWMHAELQQFLSELDTGLWTTATPRAGVHEAGAVSPASETVSVSGGGAHQTSGDADSNHGNMVTWLSAAHPTSAESVDSVVQDKYFQQKKQGEQRQHTTGCRRLQQGGKSISETGTNSTSTGTTVTTVPDYSPTVHAGEDVLAYLTQNQVGCSTHPNIQPVLLLATTSTSSSQPDSSSTSSSNTCCMVTPHHSTDAASLLRFSPGSLGGDWFIRFLIYQVLQGLAHLHSRGLALGGLSLDQVKLICPGWAQLLVKPAGTLILQHQQQQERQLVPWPCYHQQQQQQWQQHVFVVREPCFTLPQLTEMWRLGVLSNLEYLLWLNAAAGRRWGDRRRHPYVPWVIDFTLKPDLSAPALISSYSSSSSSVPPGWRDLGISQYRRIKGDAQLDQTYAMSAAAAAAAASGSSPAVHSTDQQYSTEPWTWPSWYSSSTINPDDASSTVVPPHHISNEPMSELSYAIYMARRVPVELLVSLVRRSFRPEEYPRSVEGLYHSSPDEALPQFYTDPQVFQSVHASMPDLATPAWATDAQHFVNIHRAALESDYVSANLHKWIDLNFGVALSGPAGLAAKNIHLRTHQHNSNSSNSCGNTASSAAAGSGSSSSSNSNGAPITHGVCQLFFQPHPPRCSSSSYSSSGVQPPPVLHKQLQTLQQQQQQQQRRQQSPAAFGGGAFPADAVPAAGPLLEPSFLYPAVEAPAAPSPEQLAACWRDVASLEAAAAVGSWQTDMRTNTTAAAAGRWAYRSEVEHRAALQQQQLLGGFSSSTSGDGGCVLVPAFAADITAVGCIAHQLYEQLQGRHDQQIVLSRSTGHAAFSSATLSSSSSRSMPAKVGSGFRSDQLSPSQAVMSDQIRTGQVAGSEGSNPTTHLGLGALSKTVAAAALFIEQCMAGQLSARGLLLSSFFPVWMDVAWKFMVKLLYSEQLHSEHGQQGRELDVVLGNQSSHSTERASHSSNGAGSGSSGSSGDMRCWQLSKAFESLARLAGPSGEVQELAQVPEALQLCLPAVLHVVRGRLLKAQTAASSGGAHHYSTAQQLQQSAVDFLDAVCVVLLRLASVLPPLLVQQQLVPLLQDMLLTEQQEAVSSEVSPPPAGNSQQRHVQQQQEAVSPEGLRVLACRRAVLQPLLWQVLLSKTPQNQLLQGLLPLLMAAVLEPQHDWLCPCCSPAAAAAAGSAVVDAAVSTPGQPNFLLPAVAAAASSLSNAAQASNGRLSGHPQQQQQHDAQVELASECLAVLAGSLPFPVVCQHILRPLLLALPWAGSTACTAQHSSSTGAVRRSVGWNAHTLGVDQPPKGAVVALLAVGLALPPKLAAQFVYKRVLQLALLPVLQQPSAAAAAGDNPADSGGSMQQQQQKGVAAAVHRHSAAALPVLEGLFAHVLPVLPVDFLMPRIYDFLIPAYVPSAAAITSPAAGVPAGVLAGAAAAVGSTSSFSTASVPAAMAGTASTAGAGSSSSMIALGQQPQQVTDAKFYQLADLLLLLPPDIQAIHDSPLLYPRIAALLVSALDTASSNTAATSSSNIGVSALNPAAAGTTYSSSSSSVTNLVTNWLLPQVLLLLLSPVVAAAWQQGEEVQRVYWRCVLLLYAAAVRVLGLKEVRGAVTAWHSIEVWLSTETGWEPQQSPVSPLTADHHHHHQQQEKTAIPHPLQLLEVCAERDAAAAATAAAAAAAVAASVVEQNGRISSDASSTASSGIENPQNGAPLRIVLRQSSTDASAAAGGWDTAASAGAAVARSRSGRLDSSMSEPTAASNSSSLSGRVSHLLQRIAEEKVVRRSLNTTHEFLEGVGWSQPRPAAAGGLDNPATAAASAATTDGNLEQQQQQPKGTARRTLSAPLIAGAPAFPSSPTASNGDSIHNFAAAAAAAGSEDGTPSAMSQQQGQLQANNTRSDTGAAVHRSPPLTPQSAAAAAGGGGGVSTSGGGVPAGRSWAAELNELRLLLESPARPTAAERGPSVGKEWFWLLNPKHEPSHLLPAMHHTAASSSSSSSRPWRSVCGMWWDEGWSLCAQVLHAWPAHKEKLRALAVDQGERWVVTAGRSGVWTDGGSSLTLASGVPPSATSSSSSLSSSVVRVWELADAETKVQYAGHSAAVHRVCFMGAGSGVVASLDVSGALHVWSRSTGTPLTTFIPEDLTSGTVRLGSMRTSATDSDLRPHAPAAASSSSSRDTASGPAAATALTTDAATAVEGATLAAAAAAAAPFSILAQQQRSGGFHQRGCSSSRGWQDQPALYTSRQLAVSTNTAEAAAAAVAAKDADTAAAAGGSSVVAAAPSTALALGGRLGYTCMVNPADCACPYQDTAGYFGSSGNRSSSDSWQSSSSVLLAGTADGHVCCLDVETGALVDDMVACWEPKPLQSPYHTQQQQALAQQQQQQSPLLLAGGGPGLYGVMGWEDPLSSVLTSVCCNTAAHCSSSGSSARGLGSSWIAAGSGSGRIMLLDARAGTVLASWQAHSQRVSQLQGLGGHMRDRQLLSCSQDRTLKLWDLRMLRQSHCWPGSSTAAGGGGGGTSSSPVATYKGSRDGIEGFVVYQDAAIVYGGANLGLAALDDSGSGSSSMPQQQQQPGWSAATGSAMITRQIRMTGIRGAARGFSAGVSKAGRDGLGSKGSGLGSSAAIVGLGLLPSSKLLIVGQEDGQLRVCR